MKPYLCHKLSSKTRAYFEYLFRKILAIMSVLSRILCAHGFRESSVAKKRTRKISLGRDNTETTILCPIYWLRLIVSRHVLNELHDEIKANVRNPCRHPSRTRIVLLNSTTDHINFWLRCVYFPQTIPLFHTYVKRNEKVLMSLNKHFHFHFQSL